MRSILSLLTVLVVSTTVDGQERTLREAVLAKNGDVSRITMADGPVPSLQELLETTDLIVRGVVGDNPTACLSEDGREIYTDYRLQHVQVIFPPRSASSQRPGLSEPPVVVTQLGGAMMLEGHEVRSLHKTLAPLQPGTDGMFFLVKKGDKYHIAGNYFGAFAINGETVSPLTSDDAFASEHRGKSMDQLLSEIAGTMRSLHR